MAEVAQGFFNAVLEQARAQDLLSNEHFTETTSKPRPMIPVTRAWTSMGSATNATHQSTTDPQARLARKGSGKEAKLCYAGHVQMDNRHGLVVNTRLTQASGSAEPEAALAMAAEIVGQHRVTLGADKGYDRKELVRELRTYQVTPHIARKMHSAIDRRTTRHPGYAISQIKRKRVEEIFGWLKTIGGLRKTRHRGARPVGWVFTFAAAA